MEHIVKFAKISAFIALSVATLIIIIQSTMKAIPMRPVNYVYTHQPTQGTTRSIMVC